MRTSFLNRVVLVVVAATVVFGAACGGGAPKGTAADEIKQLPEDLLEGTYLGLIPKREDIGGSLGNQEANAYIDAVGLYSLRNKERLEATLQISKLSDKARPKDKEFRTQVANQIGGTKAQAFKMSGRDVFRSSQRKQILTSWFRGDYFLILSVRDTYDTPRALLRLLLEEVRPS
jgi:hypothetical protein